MAVKSGLRSRRQIPPLILAPLVLLALTVVVARFKPAVPSDPRSTQLTNAGLSGAQPEQPLNSNAIAKDRRTLNAVDAAAAYETAKRYVLDRIPSKERGTARFSAWPPAASAATPTGERTEIDRLEPYQWRVRGVVAWRRQRSGEGQYKERFETDLQHGPADDRWRLVDTEWLDSSWMPTDRDEDHEAGRDGGQESSPNRKE